MVTEEIQSNSEISETIQPEKEPMKDSGRVKLFLATTVLEILIPIAGWASTTYGVDIPPDVLETVAWAIAGLASVLIIARTVRNTPAK